MFSLYAHIHTHNIYTHIPRKIQERTGKVRKGKYRKGKESTGKIRKGM